eukprot:Skav234104  [mRNA]  locus=scaffold183:289511:293153:- [translate_table: standard]
MYRILRGLPEVDLPVQVGLIWPIEAAAKLQHESAARITHASKAIGQLAISYMVGTHLAAPDLMADLEEDAASKTHAVPDLMKVTALRDMGRDMEELSTAVGATRQNGRFRFFGQRVAVAGRFVDRADQGVDDQHVYMSMAEQALKNGAPALARFVWPDEIFGDVNQAAMALVRAAMDFKKGRNELNRKHAHRHHGRSRNTGKDSSRPGEADVGYPGEADFAEAPTRAPPRLEKPP